MTPTAIMRSTALLTHICVPNLVGAEIGIDRGDMSECLLRMCEDLTLYMVDPYCAPEDWPEHFRQSGDYHAALPIVEQEARMAQALARTEFAGDRRHFYRLSSGDAARNFALWLSYLDFIFIDGDHTYEGTKADIEVWKYLVKAGGVLSGHDYSYETQSGKGVSKAVDEAVKAHGWKLMTGEDRTWFVRL